MSFSSSSVPATTAAAAASAASASPLPAASGSSFSSAGTAAAAGGNIPATIVIPANYPAYVDPALLIPIDPNTGAFVSPAPALVHAAAPVAAPSVTAHPVAAPSVTAHPVAAPPVAAHPIPAALVAAPIAAPVPPAIPAAPVVAPPAPIAAPPLSDEQQLGQAPRSAAQHSLPCPPGVDPRYWQKVYNRADSLVRDRAAAQQDRLSRATYRRALELLVSDVVRSLDRRGGLARATLAKRAALRAASMSWQPNEPIIQFLQQHGIMLAMSTWPNAGMLLNSWRHSDPTFGFHWRTNINI
ncbi:44ba39a6-13d8-44fd-b8d9-5b318aa25045 [Thermothielavioides terrestris]|uniref:44ba39a6-13d8-44fd-b8d9-5b318aa25045 n=1 Tax=Thermothielavioides terrestris TaxID=2587410 RepID=A0A3S4EWF5_9PEZI|nr:44ba39a6-13d8-44fd-b8d9-5b318aa25045 [Thermothielavioides terrestris]